MTKNEKIFKKYKSKFSFLLNDKFLADAINNHFENSGSFILFVIGLITTKFKEKKIIHHIQINKDEWVELFLSLYKDQNIIDVFKQLEINPIIPLNQIIGKFDCFNPFVNKLVDFLKKHEINLNIHESALKPMLLNAFGYLLYNCIDCKIEYDLEKNILDPDYDTKYLIVLNNTKLFSTLKQNIIATCDHHVNDLIVLILGMNKSLSV